MSKKQVEITSLSELMSPNSLELLSASGSKLVQQIGIDVIRDVIYGILTGKNLRDSTEMLTRRRVATLNLATVSLFLKGNSLSDDFVSELPELASNILLKKRLPKSERWLAQWILGLTDKAFQNVLRDNPNAISDYKTRYVEVCNDVIREHTQREGVLDGEITITSKDKAKINWLWLTYLLNTIGAQTLSIRGSEKSSYGKLFEKLVLGSLLHILGFTHITPPPESFDKVFWLSSRGEKRESDATLLYQKGQGVRFDIGFIGRGNTEISLDKVSRFEREISLGRSTFYMATIILVDRIGKNSRIEKMAEDIDGTIVQMSAGFWPQQIAKILNETLGLEHPLVNMAENDIEEYLQKAMLNVPLGEFIGLSNDHKHNLIKEPKAQYKPSKKL